MNRKIKFRTWGEIKYEVLGMMYNVSHNYNDYVMQFTGIEDKDGREIYEGDFFEDSEWWGGKGLVEFHNGMFGFWSDGREEFIPLYECKNIKIIGNKFENKELDI